MKIIHIIGTEVASIIIPPLAGRCSSLSKTIAATEKTLCVGLAQATLPGREYIRSMIEQTIDILEDQAKKDDHNGGSEATHDPSTLSDNALTEKVSSLNNVLSQTRTRNNLWATRKGSHQRGYIKWICQTHFGISIQRRLKENSLDS